MLRQYYWAINIIFILVVSFFSAKIANVYVSKSLEVKRSIAVLKPTEAPTDLLPTRNRDDYNVIVQRNIFDSANPDLASTEQTQGGEETYVPTGEAVKTSLSIKVLAVLVIGDGKDKRSSTTVDSGGTSGIDVYGVGDEKTFSPGVKLVQVKPNRIEFIRNGRLEYAELLQDTGENIFGPPKPLGNAVATKAATPAPGGDTIAKVAEGKFTIDQKELENALQNMDQLFTEIRAVPNFQDGKVAGMKILSVKPGSVFAKLGLKRGDILNRINGLDLDVRKGFEIFNQLKEQKSLTLDLNRNGANQTVEYEIR